MSLGILCPGQGAQSPSMFAPLAGQAEAGPALAAVEAALGLRIADLPDLAADALQANAVAQPLLCGYQLAAWAVLRPDLPRPRAFAGYSVGELAAHGCAGSLPADAVLDLAAYRARAMDAACPDPCAMAAVRGLTRPDLDALAAAHGVEIAIVNGPDRFVVAGRSGALADLVQAATVMGAGVTPLPVHVASHTSLMARAAAAFRDRLTAGPIAAPAVPVLAGIDGAPVRTRARAIDTLSAQIAGTIDWAACLRGMREMGCTVLLELGPGADLARMAREQLPDIEARSVAEFRSPSGAAAWVRRQVS
jgi:[acyl-carrier-protein] S-malonyltransferase